MSLTGSLVHDGRWYSLGSKEIACVNRLLAGEPWSKPKEIDHVMLPHGNNTIVLWGKEGQYLTATDVIKLDDNAYFLWSERKRHYYSEPDSKDRMILAELIRRISAGKEEALTAEEPGQSNLKPETHAKPTGE